MNLSRLGRTAVAAGVISMTLASQAIAATTQQPVSVAVVAGQRTMQVTGSLAFGAGSTTGSAPMAVTVTDLAYKDVGYEVNATLTNLYKVDSAKTTTAGLDCAAPIAANNFDVAFGAAAGAPTNVKAVVDSTLAFTGDLAKATTGIDTTTLVGIADTTVTAKVQSLLNEVATTAGLMNVSNGAAGTFTTAASDGVCDTGSTTGTTVKLQDGATRELTTAELDAIRQQIFDAANANLDTVLTAPEAANDVLLSSTADDPTTGALWMAVKAAIEDFLVANPTVIVTDLDALTTNMVNNVVTAGLVDLLSSVVGQTGIYANAPSLALKGIGNATTGLYKGTLKVTLVDKAS
ncbi:MAG: hypothetical protein KY462_14825 [Actinobacteria bacterium]|nr:hypothetical protein [Actinomycetota bacterium]